MNLSQIYLDAAAKVAECNQYTCHMNMGGCVTRSLYQGMLAPSDIDDGVPESQWWWSAGCAYLPITNGTYAHNARVIALLLAHEMAKTGDITL